MDKKTILAIDDSAVGLRALKTILEESYDVRIAKTTALAASVLKSQHIDLILLDIEMPGDMSGVDYLKVLKADAATKDIPVIIVTGHTALKIIMDSTIAGAIDYVIKPLAADMLCEKIAAALDQPKKT
ncbi:MAG: hypothetical protein Ta2F_00470 [Termitinemataceae bacterium]|nr:MAG: hypothetical protein Ta2F_00470 [Termitinemataceae bacterium]